MASWQGISGKMNGLSLNTILGLPLHCEILGVLHQAHMLQVNHDHTIYYISHTWGGHVYLIAAGTGTGASEISSNSRHGTSDAHPVHHAEVPPCTCCKRSFLGARCSVRDGRLVNHRFQHVRERGRDTNTVHDVHGS